MTISFNDLSNGQAILLNNEVYIIVELQHVKPGKGAAFVRARLKNLKTELTIERTFRGPDKIEDAWLEEKKMQYSYRMGDSFHFIDQTSFDEKVISEKELGESIKFLQDNMEVTVVYHDNKLQRVYLPNFIVANIVESEPGIRGDSSRAGMKPATIDTGAVVQVPLFVNKGDWVKIDTRSGSYVERVQK